MDVNAKTLVAIALTLILAATIAFNANDVSDAACIAAIGIGGGIFIFGFFGLLSMMALVLLFAYPFSKAARKEVNDLGATFSLIFGVGPVLCGLVIHLTGGC